MKTGYLVVRNEEGTKRVNLDEISVLILENTVVSLTGVLISVIWTEMYVYDITMSQMSPAS